MSALRFTHVFKGDEFVQPYALTLTWDLSDPTYVGISSSNELMHAFIRDFFTEEYRRWMHEEMFPTVRDRLTPAQMNLMCDGDKWERERERRG